MVISLHFYMDRQDYWHTDGGHDEPHATTFVNYLRVCFRYAGLSGFGWNGQPVPPEIPRLAEKLVPI